MKAITLTQPWATLVAIGAKRIETRSWQTKYRGPLAIHAAKGFPREARTFSRSDVVCRSAGFPIYPTGMVVATCNLVNILPTEVVANQGNIWSLSIDPISEQELAFGDYTPGRYAWFLEDVKLIDPVPAKGALSLWEWDGL